MLNVNHFRYATLLKFLIVTWIERVRWA